MESKHFKNTTLNDCCLVPLRKELQVNSSSLFFKEVEDLFAINRVFYIHSVPEGKTRANHAHTTCHQFILALKGHCKIELNDGKQHKTIDLESIDSGIHVPPGIWVRLSHFSSDNICLVFASEHYNENEYIHSLDEYMQLKQPEK